VASLARFQAQAGIDVAVIMPLYREVDNKHFNMIPLGEPFQVPVSDRVEHGQLFEVVHHGPGPHPRVVFVASLHYFDRNGIYGDGKSDFHDNARRYAFFCLGALLALPRLFDRQIVLHAHDWHAALAPIYLRTWLRDNSFFARVATVLSIHNAGFQGTFPPETMRDLGLPWEIYNPHQLEWYGRMNVLKGGMAFSDAVTTVSPTHAGELRTADGGFGLHEAFKALPRFVGITNGIDLGLWNPATDRQIIARYSRDDLSGKAACKTSVQRLFGLPQRTDVPLIAMSARMVYQKGLDLILGSGFLSVNAQFVFLGAGEPRYEQALSDLARGNRDKIGVQLNFTDRFEHRVLAGADICLMPSMYEPCGLTQMRAQIYGTLPLARAVGGLADTIEDGVTGFLFTEYTAESFLEGTLRATRTYADAPKWLAMQREAMSRDFGWEQAERRYLQVYRAALAGHAA
jgi:starch synthase